ncbi:fused MFS/spermidine synthase [bacterium]|nr:fused MFS/spermidine synthase [bacterium]
MSKPRLNFLVLLLFALTGLTGLAYEVLWRRMLSVAMGGSIYATAAVLSSFMGGLFLGSIVVGRWADRWKNLLRAYGLFELLIAAFALFFPIACRGLVSLQRVLYPSIGGHYLSMTGVKFAGAFCLLLFPTFLMGGTFPLLSKFYLRSRLSVGKGIGRLYSVNTGGAVLGTALAGFVLIRAFGVRGTNLVAVALNVAVGAAAIALSIGRASTPSSSPSPPKTSQRSLSRWRRRAVLAAFAISGFTALCYEVLWTRVLVFIVGNTTYSFTIMLSTFLVGLSLGSYFFSRFFDRGKDLFVKAAIIEVLIGIFALVGIVLTQSFYPLFQWLKALFPSWSYFPYTLVRYAIASISLLPPAILFGMSFPVVIAIYAGEYRDLGSDVGRAYGSNTVGAIFGSVAAVFVLIPIFGITAAFILTAAANLAIGFLFLRLSPLLSPRKKALTAACVVAVFGCLVLSLPARIDIAISTDSGERKRGKLIFYQEGAAGTVAVFLDAEQNFKMMEIDGASQVPTDLDALQAFRLLGHLPFFIHPQPKEVLVTAFGGGITTGAILTHPVERVDAVEICPSVFEAAKHFGEENDYVLGDERLRLIVGDANNYVKTTDRMYDVIASDATHPAAAESWVLYTREFYAACRELLREDGVICQWVPLHALPTSHLRIILRTFQDVFPHTSLWFARGYTVMLGTLQPLVIDVERINELLQRDKRTSAQLREVHLESVPAILKNLILDEDDVRRFAGDSPVATEDNSPLAFAENEAIGRKLPPINVGALAMAVGDGFPKVVGATDSEEKTIRAAVAIRRLYLETVRCLKERKLVEGLKHLEKVLAFGREDADLSWYLRRLTILAFRRYRKEEHLDEALRDFRRWATIFPRSPWTRIGLGHFLMDKGEEQGDPDLIDEGLGELSQAVELAPGDPIVLGEVAHAFAVAGSDEEAIPFLEEYMRRVPGVTENWRKLVGAYLRTGRDDKAIPLLKKLADLNPKDPASWSTLAGAYVGAGRYRDARDALLKALQLDPHNPIFQDNLERLEELIEQKPPPQEESDSEAAPSAGAGESPEIPPTAGQNASVTGCLCAIALSR